MKRLSKKEALELLKNETVLTLGEMANQARFEKHPKKVVSFVVDRNINYTNICAVNCTFCAFKRRKGDKDAYLLDKAALKQKVEETKALGGTQILLQGGMHPDLKIDFYEDMISYLSSFDIWVHGLSAAELDFIAKVSKISIEEVLNRLVKSGLKSIPGAADLLVEEIRAEVSPGKVSVDGWIHCMELAHNMGIRTSACLMFKKEDSFEHIIEHLDVIRALQDRTGGFTAFICWPFQPDNTILGGAKTTPVEYLRILSIARLYLDNIDNMQVSWVTQGLDVAATGLHYGANDFGSLMIEENVVSAASTVFDVELEEMIKTIQDSGFQAVKRDMHYNTLVKF